MRETAGTIFMLLLGEKDRPKVSIRLATIASLPLEQIDNSCRYLSQLSRESETFQKINLTVQRPAYPGGPVQLDGNP